MPAAKILVADDEPFIARSLSYVLQRSGFDVYVAKDGEEAYQLVEKVRPNLVILDVMMPHRTGYEVCQHIRSREDLRAMKVIILSAKGQASDLEEGLTAGADAYVPKPFSPAEIIAMVQDLLGEAAA
jgi:DNA-binding response OmpR family regulator